MYGFIRRAHRPVSREEAARTVGISRKLAAFHLDKLVEVGLLRARYEPVGGIRKVGRTPKVYEPIDAEVHISIPAKEHGLLADILIDALLTGNQEKSAHEATFQVARHRGAEVGAAERERTRPGRLGAERALTLATAALTRYGFEPDRITPTLLRLRNCPFEPLASKAPQLVCGINHAFLTGFLNALQASTLTAVLTPRPNACCVEITTC
jgi:predicted ArsR family transcriptional regulator